VGDRGNRRRRNRLAARAQVPDAGCRRLLWIGQERKTKTLLRFFRWLGKDRTSELRFICRDMRKPYLKVIAKKAGHAIHILGRFHIMASLSKAIDQVRAARRPGN